ncbi:MAG: hypothetical protein QW331_03825 [Candidatus Woesearchaeota archaeon]
MTSLVAVLTTGKGTWGHVSALIKAEKWDKIFLITNKFGNEKYKPENNEVVIEVDTNLPTPELAEQIKKALQGKIHDIEVAVNFISGEGKEHMALLSALLKLGLGTRLVVVTKEGVKEL